MLEIPLLFGQQSGRDIFALRLRHLITPAGGQLPAYGVAAALRRHLHGGRSCDLHGFRSFILGANEFTLAAFLSTPQSEPLSMYLYARINPESGQLYVPGQGAAMALIFTVMVVLASYGLSLAVRRRLPAQTTTPTRSGRQPAETVPARS